MKAIGTTNRGGVLAFERPEVGIAKPDDVLVEVARVGICGTDRHLIERGSRTPPGFDTIVLGHEMFGRVVDVGSAVTSLAPGDLVVGTVRRGCGECDNCAAGQSDLCDTGKYTERGIVCQDGYLTRFIIEQEGYLVRVPPELADVAVLAEPLSISEKAIREAVRLQQRALPRKGPAWDAPNWGIGKTAVVTGIGPIGLLATLIFAGEGATIYAIDRKPADSFQAELVRRAGAQYLSTQDSTYRQHMDEVGPVDIFVECTAATRLAFDWIERLNGNAIGVFVSHGNHELIDGGDLMHRMVGRNQVLLGIVNSNRRHFEYALSDLAAFKQRWGNLIGEVITHRFAFDDWQAAFNSAAENQIKVVLELD